MMFMLIMTGELLAAPPEIIAARIGGDNNKTRFVHDFINVWIKVMNADRFDLN